MSAILATQEVVVGGSQPKAGSEQKRNTLSEKLKQKGLGLAQVVEFKPEYQTPPKNCEWRKSITKKDIVYNLIYSFTIDKTQLWWKKIPKNTWKSG
jgi:hypothetical protein